MRTPPLLHLGMHNSLNDGEAGSSGSCRVTLYSPYWLNNRTGAGSDGDSGGGMSALKPYTLQVPLPLHTAACIPSDTERMLLLLLLPCPPCRRRPFLPGQSQRSRPALPLRGSAALGLWGGVHARWVGMLDARLQWRHLKWV